MEGGVCSSTHELLLAKEIWDKNYKTYVMNTRSHYSMSGSLSIPFAFCIGFSFTISMFPTIFSVILFFGFSGVFLDFIFL